MLIQACLNGARSSAEHPALPCTPAELARSAAVAVRSGAGSLHVHPRAADGSQSLAPADIDAAVTALRAACPGTPLGLSTLYSILPDPQRRVAAVRQWTARPDFVSVNIGEPGTAALCAALRDAGIGIEIGLATAADAEAYLELELGASCVRILLEPEEPTAEAALVTVAAIERVLDAAADRTQRLLHGQDQTAWPLLEAAIGRGYATRIGFEDVLTLPDGTPAMDNAALLEAACKRVSYPSPRDTASEQTRYIVSQFWVMMQSNNWNAAAALFADNYLLTWPQSGEQIRGRANFVAVNAAYPATGRWRFKVERLIADGETAVTDVAVTDGALTARAITFTTVHAGRITVQTEHWPDPFAAPAWRAAWVERG